VERVVKPGSIANAPMEPSAPTCTDGVTGSIGNVSAGTDPLSPTIVSIEEVGDANKAAPSRATPAGRGDSPGPGGTGGKGAGAGAGVVGAGRVVVGGRTG